MHYAAGTLRSFLEREKKKPDPSRGRNRASKQELPRKESELMRSARSAVERVASRPSSVKPKKKAEACGPGPSLSYVGVRLSGPLCRHPWAPYTRNQLAS